MLDIVKVYIYISKQYLCIGLGIWRVYYKSYPRKYSFNLNDALIQKRINAFFDEFYKAEMLSGRVFLTGNTYNNYCEIGNKEKMAWK